MARRRQLAFLTRPEGGGLRVSQVAFLMSLFALGGIALATITP